MSLYHLKLAIAFGAGNPRAVQVISRFGGAKEACEELASRADKLLHEEELSRWNNLADKAERMLEFCFDNKVDIIALGEPGYPTRLRNIFNPPIALFCQGERQALRAANAVAVVGARHSSEYSIETTKRLLLPLAANGTVIISGLALGIDKTAHETALSVGGVTVGVLACGIDVDYPKNSSVFRQQIAEGGGAVVTEFLPGTQCTPGNFSIRNRLLSGLAQGVLIIEAAEESGCHLTAAHAISQDRELLCVVPHDIYDPRYDGVKRYLRDGAVPVMGAEDIADAFRFFIAPEYKQQAKRQYGYANAPVTIKATPPLPSNLSDNQQLIANALASGAKDTDSLAEATSLDSETLAEDLLCLEIDGVIENTAGNLFKLI